MRYLLALQIFVLTAIDVFDWSQSLAPGLSVKNAILYVILLALVARFVVRGGMRMELPKLHMWFGLLIVYATLTWLTAALLIRYEFYTLLDSGIDLKGRLLDNAVLFAVYLYGTRTLDDAKFVLKCVLLAVAAANAIAIGNVLGLFHVGVTEVGTGLLAGRVFGAFGHANETAALIVCLLPTYVAAAVSSARIARWFWAAAGAVSAAMMMMTGSRGAFVGLLLAVVFGSWLCRHIISWRRAAALAVTFVAVAVPVTALVSIEFGHSILTERVTDMFLNPATSGDGRAYIWRPVVDKIMGNPVTLITGFGWDAYDAMGFSYAPHNHYLLLWFELGVIGLACYLMLMRQLVVTALRGAENASDETARYLIAFVYGILAVSGALLFAQLFRPWTYIWIYCGITMRMAVIALQTKPNIAPHAQRDAPVVGSRRAIADPVAPRLPVTQRSR
jgi:O-antigen ligase